MQITLKLLSFLTWTSKDFSMDTFFYQTCILCGTCIIWKAFNLLHIYGKIQKHQIMNSFWLEKLRFNRGFNYFDDLLWRMTYSGRWPLVEDDPRWKMTLGGRQLLVKNDLWWKTTFGGRQPSVRQPSVEDDLCWKKTFGGRLPVVENYLRWKMTFSGRQPLLVPCMLPTALCVIFFVDIKNLPKTLKKTN